jgi:putative salt-induced outer membrane protein
MRRRVPPRRRAPFALLLLLAPASALPQSADEADGTAGAGGDGEAAAESASEYPAISGNFSLGAIATSGNTESESANAELEAALEYAVWRHRVRASGYRASEEGETTAERYAAGVQSDYKFSARSYLFASARYERDEFGAFERRASVAAGVGRRFLDTERWLLELEAGAGRRVQEPAGSDTRERETIGRFRGGLRWSFAEGAALRQDVQVESGDSNTYTESVTALSSKLAGAWSLRVAYTVQHNSDVPAGTENTDTITSVSLEYGF